MLCEVKDYIEILWYNGLNEWKMACRDAKQMSNNFLLWQRLVFRLDYRSKFMGMWFSFIKVVVCGKIIFLPFPYKHFVRVSASYATMTCKPSEQ